MTDMHSSMTPLGMNCAMARWDCSQQQREGASTIPKTGGTTLTHVNPSRVLTNKKSLLCIAMNEAIALGGLTK